jgi:hypothetical protein
MNEALRYPVGRFAWPEIIGAEERAAAIATIVDAFMHLTGAVAGLTAKQLDTPYREGGWTVRQVVHHMADSHMNSYVRFKLALTESEPVIKPYDEAAWAQLPDSAMRVEVSLVLIDSLHGRWVALMRGMSEAECGSIKTRCSMPGTAAITRRTSRICAAETAGKPP